MDVSERHGMRSAFYFVAGKLGHAPEDPCYDIEQPRMRNLLRTIHARGHEIGLHTSYHTYLDAAQTQAEFRRLRDVCEAEHIGQNAWGGRQHYLRWKAPQTPRNWEQAGLDYDSTLTFSDHVGFRCGVCYEYPLFDLESRRTMALRERPLIAMDVSVLGEQYMNLEPGPEALSRLVALKETCRRFNGDFVLLWHNSELWDDPRREMYQALVAA